MTPIMPQIKHVVHLMLENRSFDNILGWLYADTNNQPPLNLIDTQNPPVYYGLNSQLFNLDKHNHPQPVTPTPPGKLTIPSFDPHEVFSHVHTQCYTSLTNGQPTTTPEMGGFYIDYASAFDSPEEIMMAFTPTDLPVLNGLARNFAVCDKWYASVPSQTFCNRAFAAAGDSLGLDTLTGEIQGMVDNSFLVDFTSPTHWNVLSENNKDWMIFYSQLWWDSDFCFTRDLFKANLGNAAYDHNFAPIHNFYNLAATGNLPSYSFLEPDWGLMYWKLGINGSDYHPPGNVGHGEAFVQRVYEAVTSSPCWKETLFIITFDEHGGTYDHEPIALGATPPNDQPGQYGFSFDTFGVRVPAIFVSPWIQPGTVFRMPEGVTPFDHTSMIATLLKWMQIDPATYDLGKRVANAPTFEQIFTLQQARTDIPSISAAPITEDPNVKIPVSDLHHLIMARLAMHQAAKRQENLSTAK